MTTINLVGEEKQVDILDGFGLKQDLGLFVGETETKLIRGRRKYKVRNKYGPSHEIPGQIEWEQGNYPERMSVLEQMYKDFCQKAHHYLTSHKELNGDKRPERIIFPDFHYETIPERFTIE